MDDNRFDDIIKGKVGEFADGSFDPSALATLHNQLASESYWPWHIRYRTELIAGTAAVVIILFTLWGQWYFSEFGNNQLKNEFIALKTQHESLNEMIREMKNHTSLPASHDTIRIIQFRESDPTLYAKLIQQINELKTALSDSFRRMANPQDIDRPVLSDSRSAAAGEFKNPFSQYRFSHLVLAPTDLTEQLRDTLNPETKKLSTKEIMKKENYKKGVGLRLGPTVEIARGFYKAGNGELHIGYGILGDIILSPSLSIETGVKYAHWFYTVAENELDKINLQMANPTIGTVKLAEIDSWALEIPIHLKYRFPISVKNSLLGKIGYSPMIYTGQELEYSYQYDMTSDFYLKDSHKQDDFQFYAGSINLSLGVSKQLKNKHILEAGLFYQHGLGRMGIEDNKTNFLGIRGVYWFPLR